MAILLQYNTEDVYTVQQLTDSTQIKMVSSSNHTYLTELLFGLMSTTKSNLLSFFPPQDILVQVLQILLKSKLLVSDKAHDTMQPFVVSVAC